MASQDGLDEDVVVCAYDHSWSAKASDLVGRIDIDLCDLDARIEHIGSTAVPGLEAKPILDLLIGLPSQERVGEAARRLVTLGWQDFGSAGVLGRRYLRSRHPVAANLHIVLFDQVHWVNNLLLRDYLRSHPEESLRYAATKRAVLRAGHARLLAYSAAKAECIAKLLSKAKEWSSKRDEANAPKNGHVS